MKRNFSIGSWITLNHFSIVEIMAEAGFDWLCVDMEHSVIKSAIQVLKDNNGHLESHTLINYSLLLSQTNDKKSVMPRTAKIYLEKNTGPKKYGGKFDLKDGEYFLHEM